MGLVLQLVETGAERRTRSVDVIEISRPGDLRDIADLGLTLSEVKQLLAHVQQAVVTVQARDHAALRPNCASCGGRCQVKDWRSRQVATLFGKVAVRLPRFLCSECGRTEAGTSWPAHCRSTPELDQLHAHLSALMPYRVAAGVLAHLLPVAAGIGHETLRCHTLKLGEQLRHSAEAEPAGAVPPASAIALSLDSSYIRSCHAGERYLEVRVGNAETPPGGRQVFGAVAKAGTDITALIRRALDTMGRTGDTKLTAFTDGCFSMRAILAAAGTTSPPILDWFHLSMRLQHAKQVAERLPVDDPDQLQAKAAIVAEVERLRWRTWNGKARDARLTLKRIRTLLPASKGQPARKLPCALRAMDRYLRSQGTWLVDYAERWRAGLRIGTSLTEGTANFLVKRRMAKSQQMCWSRRGADLLLQVRCAVCKRRVRLRLRPPVRIASQSRPTMGRGGVAPNFWTVPFLRGVVEAFPYAIHTVLTDNGMAFADLPKNRNGPTGRYLGAHIVNHVVHGHGIEHKLTKSYHLWTNGRAERMNRTVKEANTKAFHYPDLDSLKAHVLVFVSAYNFAKHLKALRWKTPFGAICHAWTSTPDIFKLNPRHLIPGPNT